MAKGPTMKFPEPNAERAMQVYSKRFSDRTVPMA
jgi:hypothetical protein